MNFLAIDVDYKKDKALVAGVAFCEKEDKIQKYTTQIEDVQEYISGEFYKRELPCILRLLKEHSLKPDCIIVDGYVFLEGNKAGLGKHLYDALDKKVKVIGVAKNPRGETQKEYELLRGKSLKPLFVTSVDIKLEEAKDFIKNMDGEYRIPTQLKLVDSLCRGKI